MWWAPRVLFHLAMSAWPSKTMPEPPNGCSLLPWQSQHTQSGSGPLNATLGIRLGHSLRTPMSECIILSKSNQHDPSIQVNMATPGENVCSMLPQTSTLPLSKGRHSTSHQACLRSISTLSWQRLGENASQYAHLWICTGATPLPTAPCLGWSLARSFWRQIALATYDIGCDILCHWVLQNSTSS